MAIAHPGSGELKIIFELSSVPLLSGVCVCVCIPILVMTFPEWLSGTESYLELYS